MYYPAVFDEIAVKISESEKIAHCLQKMLCHHDICYHEEAQAEERKRERRGTQHNFARRGVEEEEKNSDQETTRYYYRPNCFLLDKRKQILEMGQDKKTTLTRTTTEGCAPLEEHNRRKDPALAVAAVETNTTNKLEDDVVKPGGESNGDDIERDILSQKQLTREKLGAVTVVNNATNGVTNNSEKLGAITVMKGGIPSPSPTTPISPNVRQEGDDVDDDIVSTMGIQPLQPPPQQQPRAPSSQPGAYPQTGMNHRAGQQQLDDDGISVSMYTYHNQQLQQEQEDDEEQVSARGGPSTSSSQPPITTTSAAEPNRDTEAGLVEAQPVVDDDVPMAIDEAQPVHHQEDETPTIAGRTGKSDSLWPLVYGFGFCSLMVLLIGGIIALATSGGGSNNNNIESSTPTSSPNNNNETTTAPSFPVTEYGLVLNLTLLKLPNFTLRELWAAGSSMEIPQSKAYQWMQADPWLQNYTEERLLQRFVAATLYYSTIGEEWIHNGSEPSVDITYGGGNRPPPPAPPGSGGGGPPPTNGPPPSGGGGSGGNNNNTTTTSNSSMSGARPPPNRKRGLLRGEHNSMDDGDNSDAIDDINFDRDSNRGREFINITSKPWLSYEDSECEWFSVPNPVELCYGGRNRFVNLDLSRNNLQNTLPEQIGLLTHLRGLVMHRNKGLKGTIPSIIGSLTNLKLFSFGETQMSGSLPSELGSLQQLQGFAVLQSQHTGSIPSELWQLSKLQRLMLAFNKFTGTLPSDLGQRMPLLNFVLLGRTQLKGTLPPSLGLATNMGEFAVKASQFSGSIPSEIGLWSKATKVDLGLNNFSGRIPSQLGMLSSIKLFFLNGNSLLTGPLPVDMEKWNASQIIRFDIEGTGITGTIPDNLCPIKGLKFDCSDTLCGCGCNCSAG